MKYVSKNLEDTAKIAQDFVRNLKPGSQATLVKLSGDLGSGKTTFTQAVAKTLGVIETVTSPTFIIEKIYKLDHQHFSHLIHIDAYRLEKGDELAKLGFAEIAKDAKNLIFIEWPEKVADILPQQSQKISFTFIDEQTREISVE